MCVTSRLTRTQLDLMEELCSGGTIKTYAVKTGISYSTAETHRRNVLKRLNARTVNQAVYLFVSRPLSEANEKLQRRVTHLEEVGDLIVNGIGSSSGSKIAKEVWNQAKDIK